MTTERLTIDDLLLAHAAGRLPEPVGLVVATHISLSPASHRRYRELEMIGGAMLEELEPVALDEGAFERLCGRLDDSMAVRTAATVGSASMLPAPLRPYLRDGLEGVAWRRLGGIAEAAIEIDNPAYRTRLIKLDAGRRVPKHTHHGQELTVVLKGAFHDGHAHYAKGDLAIADTEVDHQPMADEGEDCICLTVTDAPLRLTGRFSRLLNPFVQF